jgi:hypothetical protein
MIVVQVETNWISKISQFVSIFEAMRVKFLLDLGLIDSVAYDDVGTRHFVEIEYKL